MSEAAKWRTDTGFDGLDKDEEKFHLKIANPKRNPTKTLKSKM